MPSSEERGKLLFTTALITDIFTYSWGHKPLKSFLVRDSTSEKVEQLSGYKSQLRSLWESPIT